MDMCKHPLVISFVYPFYEDTNESSLQKQLMDCYLYSRMGKIRCLFNLRKLLLELLFNEGQVVTLHLRLGVLDLHVEPFC